MGCYYCCRRSSTARVNGVNVPLNNNAQHVIDVSLNGSTNTSLRQPLLGDSKLNYSSDEKYQNSECPVTKIVMRDPVQASDSFRYERSALIRVIKTKKVSPMTREALKDTEN